MRSLELFAGTRSFSKEAEKFGYHAITTDFNADFDVDIIEDIFNLSSYMFPNIEILWASPPCTTFSVASIGHHWTGGKGAYIPKTKEADMGLRILNKTLDIITQINPKYWIIENPRGLMRKFIPEDWNGGKRYTVTYCQYGDTRMKPTDIWTNIPWTPKPVCKNGDTCHESAPRGSRTGTQGLKNAKDRSIVPEKLCQEILQSIFKESNQQGGEG